VERNGGSRSTLANVAAQAIHTLNDTASQFVKHSSIAASGLPIAAGMGFVPGLMFGFKGGKRMISVLKVNT
jgi:hypothetical protein